jgi:hypothetical protein
LEGGSGHPNRPPIFSKAKRRHPSKSNAAVAKLSTLEREIQTGSSHAEVVPGTINNIPAEIAGETDVTRYTNFEAAAKLAHGPGFVVILHMVGKNAYLPNDVMSNRTIVTAVENHAAAGPGIWRKARAMKRITQRECA